MSTFFVAAILLSAVIIMILLLITLHNRQKQKAAGRLRQQFSRLGAEHGLSFTAQEATPYGLFGLDGQQRKLLVLDKADDHLFSHILIDLEEVKSCTLQKQYSPAAKDSKVDDHLNKLVLRFHFNGAALPAEVVFYDYAGNNVFQLPEQSQKAKHWELILTKMLGTQVRNTA
jgi:hypothetical protein